jgi:predicted small secreted protein
MKKLFALIMILLLLIITGCETTKGLGRDIEKTGQWIQQKVN